MMTSNIRTVERDKRVSAVAGILDGENIGAMPIVDEAGSIVGIVTTSDIVHFDSVGGDPTEARVHEIASPRPIELEVSSSLADAARLMLERHVHHLIVVEDEAMVGILTSMDFVALALKSER
jgi:CBS domain-containing protein